MKLTELQIPDLKTMAAGRKTALLASAMSSVIEDRNTALGRVILWRWVAALEFIGLLSFIAVRMLKV